MAVATITTPIIIVLTVAIILVVDGFVVVVHNLPAPPPPPSSSQSTSTSSILLWRRRPPTRTTSSLTMVMKSLLQSPFSNTGRWRNRRKRRSSLSLASAASFASNNTPTTNNTENNSDNVSTPSTSRTSISTTAKEKYLRLAQEAYIQYYSSSDPALNVQNQQQQKQQQIMMSLDEYLNLAMEAWQVANNEGSDGHGNSGGDSGEKNTVPFLPIPNNSYAALTTPWTSTEPSRQQRQPLVPHPNTTNNSTDYFQGSSENRVDATSSIPIGGGVRESSKSVNRTSIFGTVIKNGWMGSAALSINNSFFGGENGSGRHGNTVSNPISEILSSLMIPLFGNVNNNGVNEGIKYVDSTDRQLKQLQPPLTEQPPQSQPIPANNVMVGVGVAVAATETNNTNGMINNFGEGSSSGENNIKSNKFNEAEEDDTNDASATVTMPVTLTPVERGPIDPSTLNAMDDVRTDSMGDVNGYETSVLPLPLRMSPPPIIIQQQQQTLPSLLQDVDIVREESGSFPLESVPANPPFQRSAEFEFTPTTTIPSVTGSCTRSFNIISQDESPKVDGMTPSINMLKGGRQWETGNRATFGSMTPSLNVPNDGSTLPTNESFISNPWKNNVDYAPSAGWSESYMGWEGDGYDNVDEAITSMDGEAVETWSLTSLNGIPEPAYFPSLHIGSRIRSTLHGTTHEGYLFTSDDSSDATDGSGYRVVPCIAKRPWSLSELNATVPTQVLAFERGQQFDSFQDQQLTLESWELDAKAAAVRRYFEVEIHMFQKFEEKKRFYAVLRRQQLQEDDVRDPDSDDIKRGDAVVIMTKAEVTVPNFLRVYPDDGSGGPNMKDAIAGYGATGVDVWGKTLDPGHEWLVYEGALETEITLSDAISQGRMIDGDTSGNANQLYGVKQAMNLPETYEFGDVLDTVSRTLLEDLVFLSSCNVVHRDIRPVNILCDSEHHRLRLTNFGNSVDLDPPRVGLDNDRLVVDVPVSIANTLAADVFSVATVICQLLFNVPEKALNRQLKGVGYDLDLWLQQALTEEPDTKRFANAFGYLRDRRGLWGFLKGAIRPNPLRKKITSDSLRQFDEISALRSGSMKLTDDRSKKIALEEAYLQSVLNNNSGEGTYAVAHEAEDEESSNDEATLPSSGDDGAFDITRVPFTLQPRTKTRESVLTELSKKIKHSAPDAHATDEAPPSLDDGEYSDLTRIQFSPPRKSLLTDVLTSYSNKKSAVTSLQVKREALPEGKFYDITRAPLQRVSPQLQEKKALSIAIRIPDIAPVKSLASETIEVKQIVAPPGKLGVVVNTAKNEGPAYVSSIGDDSPLFGRILLGDLIVAVDDLDVQTLMADEVSKILLTKSTNARRTISVLRKVENIKERQVDLGGQLAALEFNPVSSSAKMLPRADANRFDDVERWMLAILPHLQQNDVVYYCKCLISDGFDSLDMLDELMVDDLYFMKKAHQRVMSRHLSKRQRQEEIPPEMDEESTRTKKVYTVDEVLGVAARKGIEATVAAEKRLAAEKAEKEKRKEAKQQKTIDDTQLQSPVNENVVSESK